MRSIFDSLGQKLYESENHHGYLIKWGIISPMCKKWSRNRDSDPERIQEMKTYFNKGGYLPKIIHLAEVPNEGIVCYDGNHRREVFNQSNDDLLCIIDIMFQSTQNEVYKAFTNINKSVQLPAIYIDDIPNIKEEILSLVKEYEKNYKPLLSASPRCHAPNFNRDNFTDNLYDIYKHFNGFISIKDLKCLLDILNREYANERLCRPHGMYKQHIIDKCKKYNLWLFLDKTVPHQHIEVLKNSL